jgi:hypothetical protein
MLLTAKILLTLATLGYSLVPAIADFNKTHATNPSWLPHARYHVVWQVMSYVCMALIALYLIWGSADVFGLAGLWLAAGLAASAYGGFFVAAFSKSLYGGAQYDANGVLPVNVSFGGKPRAIDANLAVFSLMALLLVAAGICLLQVQAI